FQVTIATLLSARTQDATTYAASERLFRKAATPQAMSKLTIKQIEKLIYPVSFYRYKARYIKATCAKLLKDFDGKTPSTMEGLLTCRPIPPCHAPRARRRSTIGVALPAAGTAAGRVPDAAVQGSSSIASSPSSAESLPCRSERREGGLRRRSGTRAPGLGRARRRARTSQALLPGQDCYRPSPCQLSKA